MADNQEWYYAKDGQQFGPVSTSELKQLAETGQLSATDFICKSGSLWVPANSFIADCRTNGGNSQTAKDTSNNDHEQVAQMDAQIKGIPMTVPDPKVAKGVSVGIAFGIALLLTAFIAPTAITSLWFWYWCACCLVVPASLHPESMTGKVWEIVAEVLLRSVIFVVGGAVGAFFLGVIPLKGMFKLCSFETAAAIGFTIGSLPVTLLPRNWELMFSVAIPLLYVFGKGMAHASSDGGRCPRCRGTRYCYTCRGAGCPICMNTGECQACFGTGVGNA